MFAATTPVFLKDQKIHLFNLFDNTQNISPPPTYGTPPSYNLLQINTNQPTLPGSCLSPSQDTQIVYSETFLNFSYDLNLSFDRAYISTECIDRKTSANIKIYYHNLKHKMIDGQYNFHDDVPTPPPKILEKLQKHWLELPSQHVLKDNNAIRLYANPHILFDTDKLIFARYSDTHQFQHYIFGLKYIPT
jgi:hypothetical protein